MSFPATEDRSSAPSTFPPHPCRSPSHARPTCPADHPAWAIRGRHTEPRLRARPCPPGTQAAWPTGRSTLKAVAGSLRTALAPPACVTKASSPVPESSVSAPVPIPTRHPATAALDALVLGAWGGAGGGGAVPGQLLPALALGGVAKIGFSRSGPHSCTHPNPGGSGSLRDRELHPWHCCQPEGSLVLSALTPPPRL